MTITDLLGAFLLGLAGAGHCIGMCGGIASAIGFESAQRGSLIIFYHLGRIISYSLLGSLLGAAASMIDIPIWRMSLRYAAALMLIAMGLYTANWWRGLVYLERMGKTLWAPIQRLGKPLLPVQRTTQALILGALWGFLPCGLIYSALAWSTMHADAWQAAALMALFGVGTLPAMLTATVGAQWLVTVLKKPWFKSLAGVILIGWGSYNLMILMHHTMNH